MQNFDHMTNNAYNSPMTGTALGPDGFPLHRPPFNEQNGTGFAGHPAFPQPPSPFNHSSNFPTPQAPSPFNHAQPFVPVNEAGFPAPLPMFPPGVAPLLGQNQPHGSLLSNSFVSGVPPSPRAGSSVHTHTDYKVTETVTTLPRRSVTRTYHPLPVVHTTETSFLSPLMAPPPLLMPQIRRSVSRIVSPVLAPAPLTETVHVRRSVSSYRAPRLSVTTIQPAVQTFLPTTHTIIESPMQHSSVLAPLNVFPTRSEIVTSHVEMRPLL